MGLADVLVLDPYRFIRMERSLNALIILHSVYLLHHCAPGLSAAAAHGLLRTGHAVRSLAVKETDLRLRELAQGLS